MVGVSDSHSVIQKSDFPWQILFGMFYTVVLAKNSEFTEVSQAIKVFRTVAVEDTKEKGPQAYGKYRYVKYAMFLLKEFFPEHDVIAKMQWENTDDKEVSSELKEKIDNLVKIFFYIVE